MQKPSLPAKGKPKAAPKLRLGLPAARTRHPKPDAAAGRRCAGAPRAAFSAIHRFSTADASSGTPKDRVLFRSRKSIAAHVVLKASTACVNVMENTERFARGLPANNALLWAHAAWASPHLSGGARGGNSDRDRQNGI